MSLKEYKIKLDPELVRELDRELRTFQKLTGQGGARRRDAVGYAIRGLICDLQKEGGPETVSELVNLGGHEPVNDGGHEMGREPVKLHYACTRARAASSSSKQSKGGEYEGGETIESPPAPPSDPLVKDEPVFGHDAGVMAQRYDPGILEPFLKLVLPNREPRQLWELLNRCQYYEPNRVHCAMDRTVQAAKRGKADVPMGLFKSLLESKLTQPEVHQWVKQRTAQPERKPFKSKQEPVSGGDLVAAQKRHDVERKREEQAQQARTEMVRQAIERTKTENPEQYAQWEREAERQREESRADLGVEPAPLRAYLERIARNVLKKP